jgi:site-specific DNA recombinase
MLLGGRHHGLDRRLTTRQQEERTVASQLAALEKAAEGMGLLVAAEHRYVDEGYSGSRLDRPGLDALRDAAADGLLDLVLVYAPDRLARNYVHQQIVLEELGKRGVQVHFLERPFSQKPEDLLLVQMQGVIAEYERAKILERTRRGRLHKVKSGQMLPFYNPPYGYRVVRTPQVPQGVVVVDEVEATHVRQMYRWVLEEDLSARQVARRLNAQGVRPRKASLWRQSTVYTLLTNPAYAGMATYGKREPVEPTRPRHPGKYRKNPKSSHRARPRAQWLLVPVPALVGEQEQREVRERLARNKLLSPRNVRHEYLLRSLVVCGGCGLRMECHRLTHRQRHPYEYHYYACQRRSAVDTGRAERCTARRVRAEELDAVVWKALCDWLKQPQMLQKEVETWQERHESSQAAHQERARLEGACRHLQGQIDRLIDAYQQGAIEVEELKVRRERLEASLQATRVRVEHLEAQHAEGARVERLGADLEAFAAAIRDGLEALDFAGRQRLVRLLVERVIVLGEDVTIEHVVPLSGRFCRLRPDDRCVRVLEVWRQAAGLGVREGSRRGKSASGAPGVAHGECASGPCARAAPERVVLKLKPPQPATYPERQSRTHA